MYMVLFGKLTNVQANNNDNMKAIASLTAAGVDVDFTFTVVATSASATAGIRKYVCMSSLLKISMSPLKKSTRKFL